MPFKLPSLYPLIDAGVLSAHGMGLRDFARALQSAGVTCIQYRDKSAGPQAILRNAREIADVFAGTHASLILNDRADLALLAGWTGVHVGQNDLPPEDAKLVVGQESVVGMSTHNEAQVIAADVGAADYIAIGPVFATGTKLDAAAVVGLEGVRRARALTDKPLVAIGGVNRENARAVIEAGADAVAVISGLFAAGDDVEKVARDFLEILG